MNLDDIFNLTISNKPELLEEYPQLKIEYIIEKNSVRKKNKSEIVKYIYENIDVINMDLLKYLSKNIEDSIYIDDTTLSEYISKR